CYLKTVDPLEQGTPISLTFACAGFVSPPVRGRVIWDTHDEQKELSGTLVRFLEKPAGFRSFLLKYRFYRLSRGILFNLRLPGFRSVRRLFVRPVSVMQGERRYGAGTRIFEQGDEAGNFYLVRKGEVDIMKTLEGGEEVLLATLGEGDIFGEMAIVGSQPRLAGAVCRTDCLLAVADAENLDALIEGNPEFTRRLIRNFANRLNNSERTMMKSMADTGGSFRRKEELYLLAIKALYIASGGGWEGRSCVRDGEMEGIAGRIGSSEETLRDLLRIFMERHDPESLERAVRGYVEGKDGASRNGS
ncbi:MAG: cyclic nucleotide-binding domain-containing protein, partial [Chrysiogenales bacterium]